MISVAQEKKTATITAIAKDLKTAFAEGGRALFGVLYDTDRMAAKQRVEFAVEAESLPALYKEWLSQLVERAGQENLVFSECSVMSLQKVNAKQYVLMGSAAGDTAEGRQKKGSLKSISQTSCKEGSGRSACCATATVTLA